MENDKYICNAKDRETMIRLLNQGYGEARERKDTKAMSLLMGVMMIVEDMENVSNGN